MSMSNPTNHIEIITSVQRRRRWTASEKVRMVEETQRRRKWLFTRVSVEQSALVYPPVFPKIALRFRAQRDGRGRSDFDLWVSARRPRVEAQEAVCERFVDEASAPLADPWASSRGQRMSGQPTPGLGKV